MKKFGEYLLEKNLSSPKELEEVLTLQTQIGGKIGTIFVNRGIISEKQMLEILSEQLKIKLYSSIDYTEEKTIIKIENITDMFFLQNRIFPIIVSDKTLMVAVIEALQYEIITYIENITNKKIELALISSEELRDFEMLYEKEITEESFLDFSSEDEVDKLKELASEAPVIKLVNNLFANAISQRASDIHYEAYEDGMKVRYRVDGNLKYVDFITNRLKTAVVARLKLMSKMNIAENRLPQDGRISLKIAGQEVDVRASSVPTAFGESFVLRLLGKQAISYSLESLDFFDDSLSMLREIISKPNGIFLTTGPTGSGKTTTLYSLLNEINAEDIKIITVEDPVEYELEGVNQIQVHSEIDFTFSNALRSILRQDPDVIMIGEIRDKETAEISIQSSLTGHLVISTLHTNSALGAITRLLDMGIDFFLLKSSIIGLMAQRLVRKLCPHCKQETILDEKTKRIYKVDEIMQKYPSVTYQPYEAVGCKKCANSGFLGRLPIAEIAPFTQEMHKKFENSELIEDLSYFGYKNMQTDGILKALTGKTTLEEIRSVIQ